MYDYEALSKLKDYYLGKDWYIADPITNYQCNEILVAEIVSKYPKDCYSKMFYLNIIVLAINIYMLCFTLGKF